MNNPFSLVPYALAARDDTIGGISCNTLVAAGLTLLQRSAPLVRSLALSRPALLLANGPALVAALAACDGHVALVIPPDIDDALLARQIQTAGVGVIFTMAAFEDRLPPGMVTVLMDDIPARARVRVQTDERIVDLGSHVGLRVEGIADAPGSEGAVVSWFVDDMEITVSHAETLAGQGPLSWLTLHQP